MNEYAIVTAPLLGGLIGWGTNWLAVKMLFHPRQPRRVLGLTVQGVFPKRHGALAENLAHVVERELFSHEDITAYLQDPAFQAKFHALTNEYVDSLVREHLPKSIPMLSMFLSDNVAGKVKELLGEQLDKFVPRLMDVLAQELEQNISVKDTVRRKIEAFSMEQLETVLFGIMKREFKFIEYSGGVLGVLVGLAQAALLALTS